MFKKIDRVVNINLILNFNYKIIKLNIYKLVFNFNSKFIDVFNFQQKNIMFYQFLIVNIREFIT